MRTQAFGIMNDASRILCSRKEQERPECKELASLPSLAQHPTPTPAPRPAKATGIPPEFCFFHISSPGK